MGCCPSGVYSPLVRDCGGNIVAIPADGILRLNSPLVALNITQVSVSTTLVYGEYQIVLVDATLAAITISLPAVLSGVKFVIKKIDSSVNAVTIDPNGSETIDGTATKLLTSQYDSIEIAGDGTEWWII